jgi:hypothetical protein
MPRSKSSSCAHENSYRKRNVISTQSQGNSIAFLISLLFVLLLGMLLARCANLESAWTPKRPSTSDVAQLRICPPTYQRSGVEFTATDADGNGVIQCNALIHTEEMGYIGETYGRVVQFGCSDVVENLYQNIGQLLGKWISEWVNGPLADTVNWLSQRSLNIIKFPFSFFDTFVARTKFMMVASSTGLEQAAEITYRLSAGLFFLFGLCFKTRAKTGLSLRLSRYILHGTVAAFLLSAPTLLHVSAQLNDCFVGSQTDGCETEYERFGDSVASALKGGLMGCAGIVLKILSKFAPFKGFEYSLAGDCIALVTLVTYLCFSIFYIFQFSILLVQVCLQSLFLWLHTLCGPILLASGATKETEKFSRAYCALWVELFVWIVSWIVLAEVLVSVMSSSVHPGCRLFISSFIIQGMIFAPYAVSRLRIGPMSNYLSAKPISGLALGVWDLFALVVKATRRFSTPR